MGDGELGVLGDRLRWIAEDLDRSGAQLQQAVEAAHARCYEASSPDGRVEVTADGHNRVTMLRINIDLSRTDQDDVDAVLTATLNEALDRARTGSQETLLDALPVRLRRDVERSMDDARRES